MKGNIMESGLWMVIGALIMLAIFTVLYLIETGQIGIASDDVNVVIKSSSGFILPFAASRKGMSQMLILSIIMMVIVTFISMATYGVFGPELQKQTADLLGFITDSIRG